MPAQKLSDVSHVYFKLEGSPAPKELLTDLLEAVVDLSLHMPAMATVRVINPDMKWSESPLMREGKKLDIFCGDLEQSPVQIFSGIIASSEPEFAVETEPTLLVRAYGFSYKLYRGRKRRAFQQMSDGDIARKLASESGLTPGTIDAGQTHEYIFQNNETNAEFLFRRARALGYEFFAEEKKLHFRKALASPPVAATLLWGNQLINFTPRISTAAQVKEVEVRGWDVFKKEAVIGTASTGAKSAQIGESRPGGAAGATAWSDTAKLAIYGARVASAREATLLAQAELDAHSTDFIEGHGVCMGEPKLAPGKYVEIKNVGPRYNGKYYLTQVVHSWDMAYGLRTRFHGTGRRDHGVWSILDEGVAPGPIGEHGMPLAIAVVTNNKDPKNLARIRVKFPWLADDHESAWARIASPMGGGERGFLYIPEVNDEVLVGFEQGDINRPYILGILWNGKDKPPISNSVAVGGDGKVNQRVLKSRTGHTITLDDTQGAELISIIDKTKKNKIVIDSVKNSLLIEMDGDITIKTKTKITMEAQTGIEMKSQAGIKTSSQTNTEMTAQTGIKLTSQTNIELAATAQMKLSSQAGTEITTTGQLKLSGTAGAEMTTPVMLKLSGSASAELSSTGMLKLQGSLINIQGAGPVSITGLPIKLN